MSGTVEPLSANGANDQQSVCDPHHEVGRLQGVLLACIPIFVASAMFIPLPLLPRIARAFRVHGRMEEVVPLIAMLPTFGIAVSSVPAGIVADRVGCRPLLIVAMAIFTVFAIAPFWLSSLDMLLWSRAIAGLALGAMATAGATLTADYYRGEALQRWLSIQGAASAAAGVVVSPLSGVLGERNWRSPFLLVGLAAPVAIALALRPGPARPRLCGGTATAPSGSKPWKARAAVFGLTVVGMLAVAPPTVEIAAALEEKGVTSSLLAGLAISVVAAAAVPGALSLRLVTRWSGQAKGALALGLCGAGMALAASSAAFPMFLAGCVAIGIGQGLIGPALMSWLVNSTPEELKGATVGGFQTVLYLSIFIAPLLARAVASVSGGVSHGLALYGIAIAVLVALAAPTFAWRPSRT